MLAKIGIFPGNNILFFNEEKLKEIINNNVGLIKDIEIEKDFPHNIKITLTERIPVGTWCYMDNCSYFDDDGIKWGKALKSSGSLLLNINDGRSDSRDQDMVDMLYWDKIRVAVNELKKIDVKVTSVEIPPDSLDIFHLQTSRGYYIIFDIGTDISEQIKVFKIFLENKNEFSAQYVDLRIGGRIYYK